MRQYHTCPDCGANLDPHEVCDCQKSNPILPLDWLKAIRAGFGITTYQAADFCGISQSYYFAIENGKRSVPVDTAKRIARAFGFDWEKFYAA